MRPLPPLIDTVAEAAKLPSSLASTLRPPPGITCSRCCIRRLATRSEAEASTLRAAAAGRAADDATRAHQLANTARCLLELETEIGRSRDLIREAAPLSTRFGLELCELHWARGLLHRWDGEAEMASASIARALALARKDEDRWREYKCLTWLAMLAQELSRYDEMQARCAELQDGRRPAGRGRNAVRRNTAGAGAAGGGKPSAS